MTKFKSGGFTLTELLIVVVLLGLAVSFVGAFSIAQVEKYKIKNETFELERLLKATSFKAFSSGIGYTLEFKGKAVHVNMVVPNSIESDAGEPEPSTVIFSYLFFSPQTLHINSSGFYLEQSVIFHTGTVQQQLNLNPDVVVLGVDNNAL